MDVLRSGLTQKSVTNPPTHLGGRWLRRRTQLSLRRNAPVLPMDLAEPRESKIFVCRYRGSASPEAMRTTSPRAGSWSLICPAGAGRELEPLHTAQHVDCLALSRAVGQFVTLILEE